MALLAVPAVILAGLLSLVFVFDTSANAACNASSAAALVDPASVPAGPIAGYSGEQLVNAAHVMLAAQRLGLSVRDQQIGVMTAMGESGLRALEHGDAAGPDSRGLFQQRDNQAWGTLADRMDPFISSTNFFKVEAGIPACESMAPTLVANAVQRNADPYYYERFWAPATEVVQALGGIRAQGPSTSAATGGASSYALGQVQPQAVLVANTLGPMFGIKTVGGYREGDPQDHGRGLALDFMLNDVAAGRAAGDRLSAYAQQHATGLGITYVIWSQRIWSLDRAEEGWRPMEDRGSPTRNHMDHVHISLNAGPSSSPCGDAAGVPGLVSQTGWAAPAAGPMTSDYGPRKSPGGIGSTWHRGIDLAGRGCDGPIWAANAGTVAYVGPAPGVGNLIEVDHGQGIVTRYGHMYDNGLLVRAGDRVVAGQQIARIGSNGNSTGCHLHFAVQMNGGYVDPEAFLDQVGVTITS